MTARGYPGTGTIPTANGVVNNEANKAGLESASVSGEHRTGDTIGKVDRVSRVTLLGMAAARAAVMLGACWFVG
ncbi:hypothetical protein [Methylobacterium sp. V23]|jgi:hypothetical protein|uniref:hypothetical protein n=1 Tax=Methylobacterium sp. V23 TaxID=2044878 RepID=UPI000CDB5280|nr:hypothetical protein [Methylobacterium sp. V23]POR40149.1 hypothetical protein CRT23_25375 [Methylobacterium sp. V23]